MVEGEPGGRLVDVMPGGVGRKDRIEANRNEAEIGGGELPLDGMPAGIAESPELLEPGQLCDVDLAREMRPNGPLEIDSRLEITARKGPSPLKRIPSPLPEKNAKPPTANLENDGEGDVGGGEPPGVAAGRAGSGSAPAAPFPSGRAAPFPSGRAGFRLGVGDRGILCGHRFSIIRQKPVL